MGTENFIQSEVSSPDGAKFKPKTSIQVIDTISDVTKAGQLITKDTCIPLNGAFWNKDEFNNKSYTAVRLKTVLSPLGPPYVLKM